MKKIFVYILLAFSLVSCGEEVISPIKETPEKQDVSVMDQHKHCREVAENLWPSYLEAAWKDTTDGMKKSVTIESSFYDEIQSQCLIETKERIENGADTTVIFTLYNLEADTLYLSSERYEDIKQEKNRLQNLQ